MTGLTVGLAAALEQFPPNEILEHVVLAEQNGFSGVMAADHFQPWVPAQGQASFVWNVMTAIAERTAGDVGPGVTAPTFRWHPAMVAQASATMAAMYPGRHWLGLGSGEALNEHILGTYWPEAPERINRMFEAIEIITKLFTASAAGKDVKHSGTFYKLESTRLWTMPETPPEIYVATAGPITAKRAGRYTDGLITVGAAIAFVAVMEPLGFIPTSIIFLTFMLWVMGQRKPQLIALAPTLVTVAVWLVFEKLLHLSMPPGVLDGFI